MRTEPTWIGLPSVSNRLSFSSVASKPTSLRPSWIASSACSMEPPSDKVTSMVIESLLWRVTWAVMTFLREKVRNRILPGQRRQDLVVYPNIARIAGGQRTRFIGLGLHHFMRAHFSDVSFRNTLTWSDKMPRVVQKT